MASCVEHTATRSGSTAGGVASRILSAMPDLSVTETLAQAIHGWLSSAEAGEWCQERDQWTHHWPCWHLAQRLTSTVHEAGWRTSPSASYREGQRDGRLELIRKARGADDETLDRWERRIRENDPRWDRGVRALDGPEL
jgi:hypothetical protein